MLRATVLVASVLSLAACGGGGGSGGTGPQASACSSVTFSPCGGNSAGTWKSNLLCAQPFPQDEVPPECSDTTFTSPSYDQTLTLDADGSYASTGTASGQEEGELSQACLDILSAASGNTLSAQQVCSFMTVPGRGVTCSFASEKCTCTAPIDVTDLTEVGAYSTSSNELTFTPATGDPWTMQYCVSGSTLTLADPLGILVTRYARQ